MGWSGSRPKVENRGKWGRVLRRFERGNGFDLFRFGYFTFADRPNGCGFGSLQFIASSFEPLSQFIGVGKHASARSARNTVRGQASLLLPAANGTLVASEEGSDLLPRIKAVIGDLTRGTIAHPVIPTYVRCCPLPGEGVFAHYTRRMRRSNPPF